MVSGPTNPWVSRPPAAAAAVRPPENDPVLPAAAGPTAPQRGVPAPDRVDQLPIRDRQTNAELWWLGVHGGAGESTLAALVSDWSSADHAWPRPSGDEAARVVLIARSSMRGLRAAQAAATQWASGLVPFVEVLGLVVVADAPGRLPRPLRDYAQVVAGGVPRIWRVPWIESWRLGAPPNLRTAPREVRRLTDDLHALSRSGCMVVPTSN